MGVTGVGVPVVQPVASQSAGVLMFWVTTVSPSARIPADAYVCEICRGCSEAFSNGAVPSP